MDQMPLVDSMHDLIVFELEEELYELPLAIIDSINRRILVTDNKHLKGHTDAIKKRGGSVIYQKTIGDFTVILKSEL
jgi:hypothetical protein